MFKYLNVFTGRVFTGAVIIATLVGCESPKNSVESDSTTPAERTVVFNSGVGTGQYDRMTYAEYRSDIALTPQTDLTVSAILPQIWYCNGSSGFLAFIRDEHYLLLAAETGLVDGDGEMTPTFSDRRLDEVVTLKADSTYRIVMTVWTTKSVGIHTTGSRTEGTVGQAHYVVNYGKSSTADLLDRGGIGFQLIR